MLLQKLQQLLHLYQIEYSTSALKAMMKNTLIVKGNDKLNFSILSS